MCSRTVLSLSSDRLRGESVWGGGEGGGAECVSSGL